MFRVFLPDDVELFFRHNCVENAGNAAPPIGKSKTELNDFTLLMHTLLERVQSNNFTPFV